MHAVPLPNSCTSWKIAFSLILTGLAPACKLPATKPKVQNHLTIDIRGPNPHNPGHLHWSRLFMITPRAVVGLLMGALVLPIAMCVLFALARLLEAMKDEAGAFGLGRVSLALFALWVIDLITLSIVTAINSLDKSAAESPEERTTIGKP
jgi:hypothetical protein